MTDRDGVTGNPIVELIGSAIESDVRTTVVRILSQSLGDATAPASLISLASRRPVLDLHRLIGSTAAEMTFETYGVTDSPPQSTYVLQPWWLPDAHAIVTDTSRVWMLATHPGETRGSLPDHGPDFCFLTYQTFEPGEAAYTDGRGTWVSRAGYEDYIAGDLLRLRSRPGTG
jgi:hypothetical protein